MCLNQSQYSPWYSVLLKSFPSQKPHQFMAKLLQLLKWMWSRSMKTTSARLSAHLDVRNCVRNVTELTIDNKIVLMVLRPIKAGEKLAVTGALLSIRRKRSSVKGLFTRTFMVEVAVALLASMIGRQSNRFLENMYQLRTIRWQNPVSVWKPIILTRIFPQSTREEPLGLLLTRFSWRLQS